jgi:hypothetical protein
MPTHLILSDCYGLGMFNPTFTLLNAAYFPFTAEEVAGLLDNKNDFDFTTKFKYRSSASIASQELNQSIATNRAHWMQPVFIGSFPQTIAIIRQVLAIPSNVTPWTYVELLSLPAIYVYSSLLDATPSDPADLPSSQIDTATSLYFLDWFSANAIDPTLARQFLAQPINDSIARGILTSPPISPIWRIRHQATVDYINDSWAAGAILDQSPTSIPSESPTEKPFVLVFHINSTFSFNKPRTLTQLQNLPHQWWLLKITRY